MKYFILNTNLTTLQIGDYGVFATARVSAHGLNRSLPRVDVQTMLTLIDVFVRFHKRFDLSLQSHNKDLSDLG